MPFFIFLLISSAAHAESYAKGVEAVQSLQARAASLLSRAGLGNDSGSAEPAEKHVYSILTIHGNPTLALIPAGGLAFGETHLRLLVGEEGSPAQIIFSESNKFHFLAGLKALGTATQNRGRIFVELNRLVLRSGKVIPIEGTLLDTNGSLGLKGTNENSRIFEIAGGIATGLLAAPAEKNSAFGLSSDAFRKSTSERIKDSLLEESRSYLREQFREKPVLRLDEETPVTVLFKEEVRF
jgi:hypothetical protein